MWTMVWRSTWNACCDARPRSGLAGHRAELRTSTLACGSSGAGRHRVQETSPGSTSSATRRLDLGEDAVQDVGGTGRRFGLYTQPFHRVGVVVDVFPLVEVQR